MAFVDEHIEVALGPEAWREGFLHFRDILWDVADLFAVFLAAELVDQRTQQPRLRRVQLGDQVRAAFGPVDFFVDAEEHFFDLFIQARCGR